MRNFSEEDKKKKQAKIKIQENPGGLSKEMLSELGDRVKASLYDGNLSCAAALIIAKDARVPTISVGELSNRLGIRITNCQIGFFKVDKTIHDNLDKKKIDENIVAMLETLRINNELTCAHMFELAQKLKLAPMAIADVANIKEMKIHQCQLGCF